MQEKMTQEGYLELLDQCTGCNSDYCFLKNLILLQKPNPRMLCQVKCIEIFKWERSAKLKEDIGWKEAGRLWNAEKYDEAFGEAYDPDLKVKEIYEKTVKIQESKGSKNAE